MPWESSSLSPGPKAKDSYAEKESYRDTEFFFQPLCSF
jgi:hypothetical protein